MKGPESEIPGITRVTVAPATHTSQAAGHRHQSESRQKQIPRGKQNRQKNHARQRGQHPSGKTRQLVAPGRASPIQGFGKCRRHAPRTIHGGVTIKIRSRHSDFGYTRHLCSLHNLKGNANDSLSPNTGSSDIGCVAYARFRCSKSRLGFSFIRQTPPRDHEQIQQTWLHREPSPEQNLTRDRKHLVDDDNRRIASRSSG